MKKLFLFISFCSLFIFSGSAAAQEISTLEIDLSKLPKVSCNTTEECRLKATISGFCKAGTTCPLLCENNLCVPDLSCQTKDDCVKKAEAINFCQQGNVCNVDCKSAQCVSTASPDPSPTTDPAGSDEVDIDDALNKTVTCGTIGESCCTSGVLPKPRLKSPNIIFDPLVAIINGAIGVADKMIDLITGDINNLSRLCTEGKPSDTKDLTSCSCLPIETYNVAKLCLQIDNKNEQSECIKCSKDGIWTAIGCFEGSFANFLTKNILGWGIGLAGIISMMCIVYAAIKMQMSKGNPDKLKNTQEMLTSCITGLLLIIFSVFILRVLGVDILRIPGLN